MSRSLRPIYPVCPHYLRCLQLSQLPATPPSKAPVPQPFPSVRYLRMCLGKETAGNGSASHCRHCRKPGVRVTQGSAWSKRRTAANATARLRFHACARNHTALSLKRLEQVVSSWGGLWARALQGLFFRSLLQAANILTNVSVLGSSTTHSQPLSVYRCPLKGVEES